MGNLKLSNLVNKNTENNSLEILNPTPPKWLAAASAGRRYQDQGATQDDRKYGGLTPAPTNRRILLVKGAPIRNLYEKALTFLLVV